jgi:phospholipase C
LIALIVVGFAVADCTNAGTSTGSVVPGIGNDGATTYAVSKRHRRAGSNVISHVFVIVQENRTVDNLFNGLPGANTVLSGSYQGQSVPLAPVALATAADYDHFLSGFLSDTGCPVMVSPIPCPMNGFSPPNSSSLGAYTYVEPSLTKPYFAMAEDYAFGDNMFTSHLDASFISHQYLVAAQAASAVNSPSPGGSCNGYDPYYSVSPEITTITQNRQIGPDESACFTYTTIVDEMASRSPALPWRYYEAAPKTNGFDWWTPFAWIPHDQSAPGGKIIKGPSKFLNDIQSGYNASVTWITPTRANSDHSGDGFTTNTSPNWVAHVVNAIGQSSLWDSSVIFITWDDWGGWYDHVSPPYVDDDGLGVRVPFIIISPYTKKGLVTHTLYEQASILKYIEDLFDLTPLSRADGRAADPASDVMSNGGGTPRPFATISAGPYASPDDTGAPDDE